MTTLTEQLYRVRQQIARDQRRRQTALIRVPAHWAGADLEDIQRELVGLIYAAVPAAEGREVEVRGVRNGLTYHAPNAAEWTELRRSRLIRKAGATLAVVFVA